jgi:hypothetical protein
MDNPVGVGKLQGIAHLASDAAHPIDRELGARAEERLQALPRDELHHEVGEAALLLGVVERHDVGVREPPHRLRLAREARGGPGAVYGPVEEVQAERLDRDEAADGRVPGLEDHPHAAAAQLLQELVPADPGARRQPRRFLGHAVSPPPPLCLTPPHDKVGRPGPRPGDEVAQAGSGETRATRVPLQRGHRIAPRTSREI